MESVFDNFNLPDFGNLLNSDCGLDINKLLVILLLLTGKLQITSVVVYPNDFAVNLTTFKIV